MESKLKTLARGRTGKLLLEVLQELTDKVADVRTPIGCKPELENQVRIATIKVIEEQLVEKIKILTGDISPPDKNEFE